jgi:DNA ligase 1
MEISQYSTYLQKLENTTKRLEITEILAELIANLTPEEIDKAMYLSLGYLKAPFETKRLNIADRMMVKALALAFNVPVSQVDEKYGKLGDLGDVCLEFNNSKIKEAKGEISVQEVHARLMEIAIIEGTGSQEKKLQKTAKLLTQLDHLSAKYIVRIILGTTRLGFTELTVIDALSQYLGEGKTLRKQIEEKYSIHPDIGLIAKVIKHKGIKGIDYIKMEPGVPILAQKAQRIATIHEVFEKMGTVWAEFKFDGTRVQLHLDKHKKIENQTLQEDLFGGAQHRTFIKTFTRNLEETSHQYPDIIEAAEEQIDAQSIILDGEAIGLDKKTGEFLPFQEIMQRKRKHDIKDMVAEIPVKYFVFDILYLDGQDLTQKNLRERKAILRDVIKQQDEKDIIVVDDELEVDTIEKLEHYFELARDKGLEGLIVKKPDAPYQAGARSYNWVKLKVADAQLLDDTVDCVILGYYFGRGARVGFGIGGFLVGVYDEVTDSFKTFTKVGTGLKDDDWRYLKEAADKVKTTEKPNNVDVSKIYSPDVWLTPKLVVELGGDEISKSATHSAGYALRFPRLVKFRDDKAPHDITTLGEIKDLHKMQKRGYI